MAGVRESLHSRIEREIHRVSRKIPARFFSPIEQNCILRGGDYAGRP
jgi:hypothetical protein